MKSNCKEYSAWMSFRLPLEAYRLLEEKAKAEGQKKSEYARSILLSSLDPAYAKHYESMRNHEQWNNILKEFMYLKMSLMDMGIEIDTSRLERSLYKCL